MPFNKMESLRNKTIEKIKPVFKILNRLYWNVKRNYVKLFDRDGLWDAKKRINVR